MRNLSYINTIGSYSIITSKNVFISSIISITFHFIVIILALFLSPNIDYVTSVEFAVFFLSDTLLWITSLIPIISAIRKKLLWTDPYFIFSLSMFISIMTIFLGYVIDPDYSYLRFNWGGSAFSDFTHSGMLMRFAESEIMIFLFIVVILYINRKAPDSIFQHSVKSKALLPAFLTACICILLGVVGFMVQWTFGSFFNALVFEMGSPELAAISGTGKYVAFQKWAVLTFPLFLLGFVHILPKDRLFNFIFNFLFISLIATSVLPTIIYGARMTVIFIIFSAIVVLKRFGFRFMKIHLIYIFIACLVFVLFITLIRKNPYLSGDPTAVIKSFFVDPLSVRTGENEPISYLFHIDRVGNIASILEYLHVTGDYLMGKSLISGPINLIIYFINKISQLNIDELTTSTDYAFLWTYGTLDLPIGRRPPSILGEMFMQFGFWGLLPFTIIFGRFFYWLRMKQINSISVMRYWFFTVICFELLNSVNAEVGVIFKFIAFHLTPILIIYVTIYFALYGWRSEHGKLIYRRL